MLLMVKILFLCTGNSCRSQMAEGLARHLKRGVLDPYSAGVMKGGLDPLAVKAMREIGIDISGQQSKKVTELTHIPFDAVVTVCDNAREACPIFPGKTRQIHMGFEDPPLLAKSAKSEEEAMNAYRRVRDQIKDFILTLPESLNLKEEK